jgi:hypothetical protein
MVWCLAVLSIFACQQKPKIETVERSFSVTPERLDFGTVAVTSRATLNIVIVNASRTEESVRLNAQLPFVAPALVLLAPGEAREVAIQFIPLTVGLFELPLTASFVEASEKLITITLGGIAAAPPTCVSPWVCWQASVINGVCSTHMRENGTPCSDSCSENSTCLNGHCLGQAKICPSDGDACTDEVCSIISGCKSVARRCPSSNDPCKTASCDPMRGCEMQDVVDGTLCGTASCERAQVCIGGACVTRSLPNGSTCSVDSPCQSAGTCVNAVCVLPPPITLRPVDAVRGFASTVPLGTSHALLAAPRADGGIDALQFMWHAAADGIFVGASAYNMLVAYRESDGAQLWTRNVASLATYTCPAGETVAQTKQVLGLAFDDSGQLIVFSAAHCQNGPVGNIRNAVISGLNRLTGQSLWTYTTSAPLLLRSGATSVVGAVGGGAWVYQINPIRLTRLSRQGAVSDVPVNPYTPFGASEFSISLLGISHGYAWIRHPNSLIQHPLDGGVKTVFPWEVESARSRGWAEINGAPRILKSTDAGIALVDFGTNPAKEITIESNSKIVDSQMSVLDDGSSLVVTQSTQSTQPLRLTLVSSSGSVVFQCPIESANLYDVDMAADFGHVVLANEFKSYVIPNLKAASPNAGWTQFGSTAAHSMREVP